ncbi:hypothetical protein, partial [Escherichia coli]|uniref:hypothetical protein n=1 Tax=Escherichia coli TaxID=562 RepID=UPI0027E49643
MQVSATCQFTLTDPTEFEGQEILKVAPEALTLLARQAFHDASFMLRPAHQQQVADIL